MLALTAFIELEVTLTAMAFGVSLRARSRALTIGAAALGAVATALGLVFAWIIWFVAPWCVADAHLLACTTDTVGVRGLAYLVEIALAEWAWMVAVSLIARFLAGRNLAHVSG